MRLIGTLKATENIYPLLAVFEHEKIEASFEQVKDGVQVWVASEEDLERAEKLFEEFHKNPDAVRFEKAKSSPRVKETLNQNPRSAGVKHAAIFTRLIIALCALMFFWVWFEEVSQPKDEKKTFYRFTPLSQTLLYDYPLKLTFMGEYLKTYGNQKLIPQAGKELLQKAEKTPMYEGVYYFLLRGESSGGQLFEKIREGEVWRLITPVILHGSILHILFNMLWLWLLGTQVEERLRPFRYLLLMLIIGIISNTAQYLMSGPLFIGYSGIITGLAGFIWMRQKVAPWEGYPLPKSTYRFLLIFIFGMGALGVVSFILQRFGVQFLPLNLANTAHIVGLFTGMVLGKIPFFTRQKVSS